MKYEIYDLDNTLFRSPVVNSAGLLSGGIPKEMQPIKKNFNKWWELPISLDENMLIPGVSIVHQKAIEAYSDPNKYTILISHRVPSLKPEVEKLLKKYKLGFDLVILCKHSIRKPDILMDKYPEIKNAESVEIYEDSIKQILDYKELFTKLKIPAIYHLVSLLHLATLGNFEVTNLQEFHEFLI